MPFIRPTIPQLIARLQADLQAQFPDVDPYFRRSLGYLLARMEAMVAHGLHGHLDWVARQVLPTTCDGDRLAPGWGTMLGVARLPAVAAAGTAICTGLNGAVIPSGTPFQSAAGLRYEATADATVAGGVATVSLLAVDAGAAGNLDAGAKLQLSTPVSGVQSAATVVSLAGGADAESDEAYRLRIMARLASPPQGGSLSDYVQWARAAHPAVTHVWVAAQEAGAGTVTVRVMTYGATTDGIPAAEVLAAVQAYIDARRPVCATPYVVAPIAVPLHITVAITPDTPAVRAAVESEVRDWLRADAAPAATLRLSRLDEAISRAAGEEHHLITVPAADVEHGLGEMAVFGSITFS